MPFTIEPIACSRMPKAMLRPACVAEKRPPPSNSVFVDSTRSAAPPIIVGTASLNACITFLPASRVATSSPAGNSGSASPGADPAVPGRVPAVSRASGNACDHRSANAAAIRSRARCRARRGSCARRPRPGRRSACRGPSRAPPSSRAPRPRRAGRRAPSRCRPRAARRIGDVRAHDDQRRALGLGLRALIAARSASRSFASATCWTCQPCASKRFALVLGERDRRRAVDRDVVVVVEVDELAEAVRARRATRPRRRGLPSGRRRSRSRRRGGRRSRGAGRLNVPARKRSAIAMPTPFAKPWPSGPVVTSMPAVWPHSGWPGVREPHWRNCFSSSSERS